MLQRNTKYLTMFLVAWLTMGFSSTILGADTLRHSTNYDKHRAYTGTEDQLYRKVFALAPLAESRSSDLLTGLYFDQSAIASCCIPGLPQTIRLALSNRTDSPGLVQLAYGVDSRQAQCIAGVRLPVVRRINIPYGRKGGRLLAKGLLCTRDHARVVDRADNRTVRTRNVSGGVNVEDIDLFIGRRGQRQPVPGIRIIDVRSNGASDCSTRKTASASCKSQAQKKRKNDGGSSLFFQSAGSLVLLRRTGLLNFTDCTVTPRGTRSGHLRYGTVAIFAAISALNCFRSSAL